MDNDKIEKLKQLSEFYKEGILTKEELETEKKKILEDRILYKEKREENLFSPQTSGKETHCKQDNFINVSSTNNPNRKLVPNKKRLIYLIATIIILIGIGVFIGLYQHHQNVVAQQREQEMLDSIAEVERLLEIRRQDSIAEVERKCLEYEVFIKNHPVLLSTFLTVTSKEFPYLSFNSNIAKKLDELKFDKVFYSYIDYEAGTDGSSWECLKSVFQRDGITITLITQIDDINNVYDTKVNFSSDADLKNFLQNTIKIGFTKHSDNFYAYGENWGWSVFFDGNQVYISYSP